jgi:type I restriction-modification system DNA methylase subunit
MAKIFKENKIKELVAKIPSSDLMDKIEIAKRWHNDYHNGSLKVDKETSREQAFNQDFFVKILGYAEKPEKLYSLEPKATSDKGQLPDAIIGYFNLEEEVKRVSAVVELKGASISLDKPQKREGNMSPIQQAFKYKSQYRACPFVLVSNFYEFRLFQDNQLDYEIWTLNDLVNPDDDYFQFKKFYYLLNKENFTSKDGQTNTERLLSDIRVEQEEISKKFYAMYKDLRIELLRDIYYKNPDVRQNIEVGIEKAQKIIDRVVFICFCEDRGLLPDNTLPRTLAISQSSFGSLWNVLQGLFDAIDKGSEKLEIPDGYNGGLFKEDVTLNNLKISDEVLKKLAGFGEYNFSEDLSVNILGHIFEQSITDLEEIKNKVQAANDLPTATLSKRKKDGIFYTPDFVVDYIIENSLGTLLREKEQELKDKHGLKDDIQDENYEKRSLLAYAEYQSYLQNVKVLDPACGSGAFLVKVFDYLLKENERVGHILGGNLLSDGNFVKSILQNNIFGVDLNSESVEITKLSLWLKTAQKGKKLTTLDNNIKCGNSLIDDESLVGSKAFDWSKEFKDVMKNGGFDVVVGNPPYVRQELLTPYKPYLSSKYKCFAGTTDLFAYFYELGLNVLKKDGLMSFISNTFAKTTGAGEVLRKYLQENSRFEQVIDFGTLQIFEGATTYPIIVVLRKDVPAKTFDYLGVKPNDLNSIQAAFLANAIQVSQLNLKPESWIFQDTRTENLRTKLASFKTVSDVYGKSYYGIKTGLNDAFIVDRPTKEKLIEDDQKSVELIKPFWEGKDIQRWNSDNNDKYVVVIKQGFTKALFSDLSELEAYNAMLEKFPAVMRHLSAYETASKERSDKGDYWWEMRSCAYYNLFEQPKITWANLQSRGKFCWDDSGKYINAPAVILPTDDKALLGVLNSSLVWFYLSGICVARSGGYLEIKPQYFSQIPVPSIPEDARGDLATLVDANIHATKEVQEKMLRFKKLVMAEFKIEKWGRNLSKWWTLDFAQFSKALGVKKLPLAQKDDLLTLYDKYRSELIELADKIKKTDDAIDALVFDLYQLTPDEVKIVRNNSSISGVEEAEE